LALTPGTRIGVYQIAAQIGVGGMGEVYQATDTNLKRQAAIKVLPASVAGDADRLARFQREAEVLAALNHPNIAQIFGLEKTPDFTALVMELVEGDDLSQRIARGAIPLDEALPIAKQIAEALEAAHEQGIIHRDLKPANIKVRSDGTVKVLDFGLAKAMESPSAMSPSVSQAPTITTPAMMTGVGMILGTAAYMSPEQARGKTVDKRADIWAFGAVLFEMLTGKRAFPGEDITDTLAAVVKLDPKWDAVGAAVPARVNQVLRVCLQKDPRQRAQAIGDVRLALEGAFETGASQGGGVPLAAAWRQRVPVALTASVLTAVVVGLAAWSLWPSAEPRSVTRFEYVLPGSQDLGQVIPRQVVAVSADGRHFVYSTDQGLYIRAMGELDARLIPGTEGLPFNPVLSPTGESVAYFQNGQIKRIATSGGAPVVIVANATLETFSGMSWGTDDAILFAGADGVFRVSASGGAPELLIPANKGEQLGGPQPLPDRESVLFSVTTATGPAQWDQAQIAVHSLRTGERTLLLQRGSAVRYLPTGHLIYALGDTLLAVAFDVGRLALTGEPVQVMQGIQRAVPASNIAWGSDASNYGVSDRGTLVYLVSGTLTRAQIGTARTLVWVNRDGREEPLDAPPRPYSYPRLSPDGTQVAVDVRDPDAEIWVWNIVRDTLTRLTFDPLWDRFPVWSPDGRRIAFSSQRDGSEGNPFWQAADGTGQVERLADQREGQVFPTSFSPDGTRLLLIGDSAVGTGQDDIRMVSFNGGDRAVTPLLATSFNERNPEVSPDGRWLAYESDETGRLEIYVRPFPEVDAGRWQVSTGGGTQPLWARSGRELFYRSGDALMVVPNEVGRMFAAHTPARVLTGQYAPTLGGRNYDVSPDGQRFLMLKVGTSGDDDQSAAARFTVVENWTEELKRLVPVD
jgi:serine/threonine-protein kinase